MITLKDHQRTAVDKMHEGCVLRGGTGSGKTVTSLAYYFEKVCGGTLNDWGSVKEMKDLVVITTARKRDTLDWQTWGARFGISTDRSLSIGGAELIVDSWNNLSKYVDQVDTFFILDEQRLVGTGSWVKAFYAIAKNNDWIMLSATPADHWLDFAPVFIANGYYKNITEFRNAHVRYSYYQKFPKVEGYIGVNKLVKLRNQMVVEMPYEKHTTRHLRHVETNYSKHLYDQVTKKRWNPFDDEPITDAADMFRLMRRIVNSDESRIDAVRALMEHHNRLIVFYNFDYELEMLRNINYEWSEDHGDGEEWGPCGNVTVAEYNGHRHDPVPDDECWVYLVQYLAGAEAWDCIQTDATVFYSLTYSFKQFDQSQGRIDRLNTPFTDLYYYILKSKASIDRGIWAALGTKKSFNERDFR